MYLGGNISTQEESDKDVERRLGFCEGNLAGAGEGFELQGTEQGHKDTRV